MEFKNQKELDKQWEELSEEHKQWWNNKAKEIGPERLNLWENYQRQEECFFCKTRIKPFLVLPNKNASFLEFLNKKWLFHCYVTHGLPPEIIYKTLSEPFGLYKQEDAGLLIEALS